MSFFFLAHPVLLLQLPCTSNMNVSVYRVCYTVMLEAMI